MKRISHNLCFLLSLLVRMHNTGDVLYVSKRIDYTIYDPKLTLVDPSGVQVSGLENYKSAVAFFQTFVGFWFTTTSGGGFQFRMVYDFCRCTIRISWHAVLVPKWLPMSPRFLRRLHVDGISTYQLDRSSGKIMEHRIENLMINQSPVQPPYGMFSILQYQDEFRHTKGVPVGAAYSTGSLP